MIMFTTSKNGNLMKLVLTVVWKNLTIFAQECSEIAIITGLRLTRTSLTTGSVTADRDAPTKAPTAPWDAAPMTFDMKLSDMAVVRVARALISYQES
mmetsp:Transcript_5714/g.9190  ORF Transcript_5714/g.9190 Transcript_5714/m.9190 type:complete len:97 (+) Transcript_5714:645-935(+)